MTTPAALSAKEVSVSVPGRSLVDKLDPELRAGEIVALLGRNGVGKSLLLHTLAGLRDADPGYLAIQGDAADSLTRRDIARRLALLPQDSDDVFPASVLETVLIGRHPHVGRFGWESAEDVEQGMTALRAMGLEALRERDVLTLSGGERRRLAIAQCLAQDTPVLLLDEPTNHLDPQHQVESLDLFRRLADDGRAILASLHDVNVAARYADRSLLLFGDGRWQIGATDSILTTATLEELYGISMQALPWQDTRVYVPAPSPRSP